MQPVSLGFQNLGNNTVEVLSKPNIKKIAFITVSAITATAIGALTGYASVIALLHLVPKLAELVPYFSVIVIAAETFKVGCFGVCFALRASFSGKNANGKACIPDNFTFSEYAVSYGKAMCGTALLGVGSVTTHLGCIVTASVFGIAAAVTTPAIGALGQYLAAKAGAEALAPKASARRASL